MSKQVDPMSQSKPKRPGKSSATRPAKGQMADAARVTLLLNEAAHLLQQHRPGEAVTRLEQARQLTPENVMLAINLGGAYIMQGKHRQAVPILEAASRLEPDNPMIWTNLAAAYLGRLELSTRDVQDKAIGAFERALQIDPQAPNINYNLGLIYRERNDIERACAHFARAIEVDPDDRDARTWFQRLSQPESMGETEASDD